MIMLPLVKASREALTSVRNFVRLSVRTENLDGVVAVGSSSGQTVLSEPSLNLTFATLDDLAVAAAVVPYLRFAGLKAVVSQHLAVYQTHPYRRAYAIFYLHRHHYRDWC